MRFLLGVTCGMALLAGSVLAQNGPALPPGFTYGTKPKPQDSESSSKASKAADSKPDAKSAAKKPSEKAAVAKSSADRQEAPNAPATPSYRKSTTGPGIETGGGHRTCAPDEKSPDGTVDRGFRKVIAKTPFGESCRWEPVEDPSASDAAVSAEAASEKGPAPGIDVGGGYRSCAPDEKSPSGTIRNGYRKVEASTAFGNTCRWEPVARAASVPEKN